MNRLRRTYARFGPLQAYPPLSDAADVVPVTEFVSLEAFGPKATGYSVLDHAPGPIGGIPASGEASVGDMLIGGWLLGRVDRSGTHRSPITWDRRRPARSGTRPCVVRGYLARCAGVPSLKGGRPPRCLPYGRRRLPCSTCAPQRRSIVHERLRLSVWVGRSFSTDEGRCTARGGAISACLALQCATSIPRLRHGRQGSRRA